MENYNVNIIIQMEIFKVVLCNYYNYCAFPFLTYFHLDDKNAVNKAKEIIKLALFK